MNYCLTMCNGVKDNNGECCHIKDKNWIIGQVKDHEEVLKRVQKHYDKNLRWNDLFIDYDEGKKLFPSISPNKTWSGFIFSLVFSVVSSCIFSFYFNVINISSVSKSCNFCFSQFALGATGSPKAAQRTRPEAQVRRFSLSQQCTPIL